LREGPNYVSYFNVSNTSIDDYIYIREWYPHESEIFDDYYYRIDSNFPEVTGFEYFDIICNGEQGRVVSSLLYNDIEVRKLDGAVGYYYNDVLMVLLVTNDENEFGYPVGTYVVEAGATLESFYLELSSANEIYIEWDGDLSNPYDGEFYKVSDKAYNFTDCYFDIEMLVQYSDGEIMTITNDSEDFEAIVYKNAIFFCESVVFVSDTDNPLGLDVGVYFYGSDNVFIKSFKVTLTPITEPIDVNIEFECDYNNLENIEQFGNTNLLKVSDEVFNLSGTESNVTIGFKWISDGKVELVYSGTDNYYVEIFKNGFF
jgi:hypothetical protein